MWRLLTTIEAAGLTAILSLEPLEAQRSDAAPARSGGALSSVSGAPRLSPRVITSYHAEQERGRSPELVLAVLWRGQLDWPARARGSSGHGEEGTATISPAGVITRGPLVLHLQQAGAEFDVRFDPQTRRARLLGREIALGRHNVILVDHVDGIGGPPAVVGTTFVDPRVTSLNFTADSVLRRSEVVRAFLR